LAASLPLILLFSWHLAFAETYRSWKELKNLKIKILEYGEPDILINQLQRDYNNLTELELNNPEKVDNSLLDMVSRNIQTYNIQLEEFPEIHIYTSSNYLVQTHKLSFSGRFNDLLRFTWFVETEIHTCRLISVKFYRKETRQGGEKLFMELYLQSVFRNN
jgi:hypothetical protein